MNQDEIKRRQHIASIAGSMTGMFMETIKLSEAIGLDAHDVTFAALLSLRSVLTMLTGDEQEAKAALRSLFEEAYSQPLMHKTFENEDEARAYLERDGLTDTAINNDGTVGAMFMPPPEGPVH